MKLYDCSVWIKGIGLDSYWVHADSPRQAAIFAADRIREETDATEWKILGIVELRG